MISFAQNAEDVVLNRVFESQGNGFYVDVGAGHPIVNSVTKTFYDRGWNGINIEPRPELHSVLSTHRPRDINLQVGAWNCSDVRKFHQVFTFAKPDTFSPTDNGEASTFDAATARQHAALGRTIVEHQMKVETLSSLLQQHQVENIDFLKIDVEGAEDRVLRGLNLSIWRPRIVVVEAINPFDRQRNPKSWESLIANNGYRTALFDGLNLFFVRQEESDEFFSQLSYPAAIVDDFMSYRLYLAMQEVETLKKKLSRGNWLRRIIRGYGPKRPGIGQGGQPREYREPPRICHD